MTIAISIPSRVGVPSMSFSICFGSEYDSTFVSRKIFNEELHNVKPLLFLDIHKTVDNELR